MNSFDVKVDYICNEKSGITVKYHHVSCPTADRKLKVFNLNNSNPPDVIITVKVLFYGKGICSSANLSRGIRSPFRVSRKIEKVKNYCHSRSLSNIDYIV